MTRRQKKLIKNAFRILNDNGILVYSTCTFAPEENEEVVQYLLDMNDRATVEKINVNVNHSSGILSWKINKFSNEMQKCFRIYTRHNSTSGFFIARIRKA